MSKNLRKYVGTAVGAITLAFSIAVPSAAFAADGKPFNESIVYTGPYTSGHNQLYDIKGAEYTFYTTEAGAKAGTASTIAKTAEATPHDAILVINNDNGSSIVKGTSGTSPMELTVGDYWVVETTVPKGLKQDSAYSRATPKKVTVTANNTEDNPVITTSVDDIITFPPTKIQKAAVKSHVEGAASLANMIVKVEYWDVNTVAETSGKAPVYTWYFKSDNYGAIDFSSGSYGPLTSAQVADITNGAYEMGSSDWDWTVNGSRVFLLGTYKYTEIWAPEGMLLVNENNEPNIYTESLTNASAVSGGTSTHTINFKNPVLYGGVYLEKLDSQGEAGFTDESSGNMINGQGNARLSDAEFTIYNANGKSIYIGDTQYANGAAICTITTKYGTNTTFFPDGKKHVYANTASNTTLPYGQYLVKETKAPVGYRMNEAWNTTGCTIQIDGGSPIVRQTGLWYRVGDSS